MAKRWKIEVELTWDVDPEDLKEKYPGDAMVDFSRRGLERVRDRLNGVLDSQAPGSHDGPGFAHYHIIKRPEICEDS